MVGKAVNDARIEKAPLPPKLGVLLPFRLAFLLKDGRCQPSKMLVLLTLTIVFGASLAQRPNNVSLCDYYAESLFGTNTNVTQLQLMQNIIVLAFAGPFTLPNVDPALTGYTNSRLIIWHFTDFLREFGILDHITASL